MTSVLICRVIERSFGFSQAESVSGERTALEAGLSTKNSASPDTKSWSDSSHDAAAPSFVPRLQSPTCPSDRGDEGIKVLRSGPYLRIEPNLSICLSNRLPFLRSNMTTSIVVSHGNF